MDIIILANGPTQGLDDITLGAEGKYYIDFSRSHRNFCLSLHIIRARVFYAAKLHKFKAQCLK